MGQHIPGMGSFQIYGGPLTAHINDTEMMFSLLTQLYEVVSGINRTGYQPPVRGKTKRMTLG